LQILELRKSLEQARRAGTKVRALVVINPGNPTGNCLKMENMVQIVELCKSENLVLMADEVYQENVYGATPFTSFKKVARSLGKSYDDLQMVSFHSVSKGFLGECGQRGGYMEVCGMDEDIMLQFYKLASISLCSGSTGQIMVGLMVNPPAPNSPSFPLFEREQNQILQSLKRRAKRLAVGLNDIPGVRCNPIAGAMYAFPRISLPVKFVEEATAKHKHPDLVYCMRLVEETGIVVVPGSGFGQYPGTYHFRNTILPPEDKLDEAIKRWKAFHTKLLKQYA